MKNIYKYRFLFIFWGLAFASSNGQTGKAFVFKGNTNEQGGIGSVTLLTNGKFAYSYTGESFFRIHIVDTGGYELLSRKFTGGGLNDCKLIYSNGYIYGLSNNMNDGDSAVIKSSVLVFKLDTCLNLVSAKQVYYRNPLPEFQNILTSLSNNPSMNNKGEFFFPLLNINNKKVNNGYSNILIISDTQLNLKLSPYYPASTTDQTSSNDGIYQLSGHYYEKSYKDSTVLLMKPYYSELNPETNECNLWVVEQTQDSIFGFVDGFFDPSRSRMYVNLSGYNGNHWTNGVVDYKNLDYAKYSIMCDTSLWSSGNNLVYNWGIKNQLTVNSHSDFKDALDQNFYTTIRTYNEDLVETGSKKIHGWGNLNNGIDDLNSMFTFGAKILTNNKLMYYGCIIDERYNYRAFFYVIDSNLNFATKTILPEKYHCDINKVLPDLVITPKDTFFLTSEMFQPAKVIVHNIRIKQLDMLAGLTFSKPLVEKKSNHMLIKYLPNNQVECEIKGTNSKLQYALYDLSAKKILDGSVFDNKIVISKDDLNPGIYIISITKKNEIFSEKIIIE